MTTSWTPANFDHSTVTGRCDSCHNGQNATGKSTSHVQTVDDCGTCHMTTAWIPANFDHGSVVGTCSSCHLSQKPIVGHFVTSQECNICHNTVSWTIINFIHSSANYSGDHPSSVGCYDCHTSKQETINVRFPAYGYDCAGCHADDWPGGDTHKHIVSGVVVNYTIDELKNCAGSCHKEADFIAQHHTPFNGNGIQ